VKSKVILPSAALMGALMLGAVFMHFKVSDEAIKFLPAGLMLLFSLTIILMNRQKELS